MPFLQDAASGAIATQCCVHREVHERRRSKHPHDLKFWWHTTRTLERWRRLRGSLSRTIWHVTRHRSWSNAFADVVQVLVCTDVALEEVVPSCVDLHANQVKAHVEAMHTGVEDLLEVPVREWQKSGEDAANP